MKISNILTKIFDAYDNWKHPKKFNIGDNVRRIDVGDLPFWQDLTVVKYDFYIEGGWWLYVQDNVKDTIHPMRERNLALITPAIKEYKYDQSGDTEDDI